MGRGTDNGIRGIYRTATAAPLPVLANELFLRVTNAREGEPFVIAVAGAYAPVVIIDTVNYFPTIDPIRDPFMIIDVNTLIQFLELRGLSEFRPNEIFISTDPARHEQVSAILFDAFRGSNVIDRTAMLAESTVDPLAVAGWRGISVVAVIVAGAAAVLGYATYLSAHARRTQHEAAYMRSIGLSRFSYLRLVIVEHTLLAALGIGLGIASGLFVSRIAVSSIAHTATGRELIPPFVLQTNWLPPALLLSAMAIAAALSIGAIVRSFSRSPIHELVRTRE
jgi:ABC-type antimicrobial peptide transport system permease subunit